MSERRVEDMKTEERRQREEQIIYEGINNEGILSEEKAHTLHALVVKAKHELLKEAHKLIASGYAYDDIQAMLSDAEDPLQREENPFLEEAYNLKLAGFSYQDIFYSIIREETEVNNDKEQIEASTKGEQMEGKITYYSIDENEAQTAHSMKYYYPYEHGTKTREYRAEVDKIYDMVTKITKIRPEATETAYQLANQFSKEMADNMNQAIKVECMCPSDMIAGAKNISARMRKQQDTARMKNHEEYREIKKIEKRLNDILTGKEKIQKKTINSIKETAEKVTEEKESLKLSQQLVEEEGNEQQPIEKSEIKLNNKYFKVVENMELEKLQLTFTSKPNEKMRDILKDNHFHWSWENRAWETSLTDDAKEAAKNVAARFEELEKQGKLELEKLKNAKPSYMKNKKFHGKEFQSSNYDHDSLEKQVMLKQNKRIKEQLHDDTVTKLDQTQDILHQEQLGMVEDVDVEIEIGE